MPTVLDSFVVEFGLDPSKFTQGQRALMQELNQMLDQSKKYGSAVEEVSKKVLDLFSIMRREALVAFGGFFGGREIVEMISHFTNLETRVSRLGEVFHMSGREVMAFGLAFKGLTGGQADEGVGLLNQIGSQIMEMQRTGIAPQAAWWGRFGVSPIDQKTGVVKSPEQMILEMSAAMQRQTPDKGMQASWLAAQGITGNAALFFMQGPEKIKAALDTMRAFAPETDRYRQNLDKLQLKIAELDGAWQKLGATLTNLLQGPFGKILDSLISIVGMPSKVENQGWQWVDIWKFLKTGQISGAGPVGSPVGEVPKDIGEKRAMMDQIFAAQGIDPNIAWRVYQSEGAGSYVSRTDFDKFGNPNSFGDFQLHYSGDPAHPALGDIFTKQTGLDARDPATTRAQYDFIAKWVKEHGWGDFHGWKGNRWEGVNRQMGMNITNNVTINDKSGNPGKTAGVAVDDMNRRSRAWGIGPVALG